MFKRIGLFLLTNLLVMTTIGIVWGIVSAFLLPQMTSQVGILMVFCLVFGMVGSFVSLLLSRWMAKAFHGVKLIEPNNPNPQLSKLVQTVYDLARKANLPKMPQVGIYESDDINAFATGPSKSKSLVAVSTGLLQQMTTAEIEGVLGHEITHIANGDMVTMTLIQGIVNSFAMFFSRILASVIASNVEERNRFMVRWIATIIGDIAFTMLGSILVAWFSRRREFRADRGGANLAGRSSMVAALRRLQTVFDRPLLEDQDPREQKTLAALQISSRDRGGIASLFMTHPPLEVRIAALQRV